MNLGRCTFEKLLRTQMFIMFELILLIAIVIQPHLSKSQSYLVEPPAITHNPDSSKGDVEWVELAPGVYSTTLTFSARSFNQSVDDVPCTFTTRLFNGSLPGPTWMMKPGNQYRVTLINELGPESEDNPTFENVFKDPNTTNIHTHGLHVSGEYTSDNIFTKVSPESSHTYIYNIPCDHSGGLYWYHTHHHGSTSVQLSGGAAGALIMEESLKEELTLPEWYLNMNSILIFLQFHYPRFTDDIYLFNSDSNEDTIDLLFSWNPSQCDEILFYTVNGQYQPTVSVIAGEWNKFRFVHVDPLEPMSIYITETDTINDPIPSFANCQLKLLAKDGIPIHGNDNTLPRNVTHIFLQIAQRADVAIMCLKNETEDEIVTHTVHNHYFDTLFYIEVSGVATEPEYEIPEVTIDYRPDYIPNMLNFDDNTFDASPNGRFDITLDETSMNNIEFDGDENTHFTEIEAYSYHEWNITGIAPDSYPYLHPFHMHLFPFQLMSGGNDDTDDDIPENWIVNGDFIDVLHGPGVIRFFSDQLGGQMAMHCHIVYHSDQGSINNAYVLGGCDEDFNDIDPTQTYPLCSYDDELLCETNNPSNAPSGLPSDLPSILPSLVPSESPSDAPTQTPSMPTDYPSQNPSNAPSNSPTQPTNYPSNNPSNAPSNSPSQPTTNPTNTPSISPTMSPTSMPIASPTSTPSDSPSFAPIESPTAVPVSTPSNSPSTAPFNNPSNAPSNAPIDYPSTVPSSAPSNAPSEVPSNYPTLIPNVVPSYSPTNAPTNSPIMPTIPVPTNAPTLGFTEGECCHARDNTDRMELRCNALDYINLCLSRYWQRRCQWDFDLQSTICPLTLIKDLEGDNCFCDFESGGRGVTDDRLRRAEFCSQYEFNPEFCEAYECGTWVCYDSSTQILNDTSNA